MTVVCFTAKSVMTTLILILGTNLVNYDASVNNGAFVPRVPRVRVQINIKYSLFEI